MWENETVVLVVSFKKRILSGKDKVRFSKISADNAVPPFIKILFQKRVEKYLITESPLSIQPTPHFDLQPEDLANMKGRFLEVLREVALFHEDEVESILREALVLRLEYLIKPVNTMRKILFEERAAIDLRDIEGKLEPFSKLLPYADQFLVECKRLGYKTLEHDEYDNIVSELLQKIIKSESLKTVLHDFSVAKDFLSETKGEEISRVDGSVLQDFLADRNLWGFRKALEVEMKLGKEDFDSPELEVTLKRYMELKEEFSKAEAYSKGEPEKKISIKEYTKEMPEINIKRKPEEKKLEDKFETLLEENKIPALESQSTNIEETWDLDEVLNQENSILELEDAKEKLAIKSEEKPKAPKSMRIIRRDQKEEEVVGDDLGLLDTGLLSEKPEFSVKRSGLKTLIDEKTEKVFIKKLFSGDASSYGKLLEKLDESESWRVAKILIDNELFKRDVDPFSREAIKLVDLIYSRYYPEEGIGGVKP